MHTTRATTLERNPLRARQLHAAVYLVTLPLLITGWWLLAGREGQPSVLALVLRQPDSSIHQWLGWSLLALASIALLLGGTMTFLRETLRYDRGDARWLLGWPKGALLGHFARHEGHFDPGQRIANLVIILAGVGVVVSGVGLVIVPGGALFVWLHRVHQLATFVLTPVLVGHVLIALGVLPGYDGVWRAMHLGGKVPIETAHRIWPAWTERALSAARMEDARGQPDQPPTEKSAAASARVGNASTRSSR